MDTWVWITIAAIEAVIIVAVVIWWVTSRRQESEHLQQRLGPEHERVVSEPGGQRKAEQELRGREKRIEKMDIRPLSPDELERYSVAWAAAQAHFVDAPQEGVDEAERLIIEMMSTQGYPMADFDQRAADISVDHPDVVSNYRYGRQLSHTGDQGDSKTESLRQAMVHYRALFGKLLEREPARR